MATITDYPKHAAMGGAFVSPPLVFTTNTKIKALVVGSLLLLLFHLAAGGLVAKVTPLGGTALFGFNLLFLPPLLLVFNKIAELLGFKLWGKERLVEDVGGKDSSPVRKVVLLATALLFIYTLVSVSRLLCNRVSSDLQFGASDSFKLLGHCLWMSIPFCLLGIIKKRSWDSDYRQEHFSDEAIVRYWANLSPDLQKQYAFELNMTEKVKIYLITKNPEIALSMDDTSLVAYFSSPLHSLHDQAELKHYLAHHWMRLEGSINPERRRAICTLEGRLHPHPS